MIALFNRARANFPRRSLRERLTLLTMLALAVFSASFGVIGARAITTVGSNEKAALCKSWGVDCVLNYKTDDVPARIKVSDPTAAK